MIFFQMHIMWYESEMLNETLDSIQHAIKAWPEVDLKIHLCINLQTYLEKPVKGSPEDMIEAFIGHSLLKEPFVHITYKTDEHPFYNIADWRREEYDIDAKYTVWGESDCLLPVDFFYIISSLNIEGIHVLSFASRPMWDDSWEEVTHSNLRGYSKPCECTGKHKKDCIELLPYPLKYKDTISQTQLDEFNNTDIISVAKVSPKIDGALVCISGGINFELIPRDMHFVREDTCVEYILHLKNVPQFVVENRMKGHNYKHPLKRVNTSATRDDEIFNKYAMESIKVMSKFLEDARRHLV